MKNQNHWIKCISTHGNLRGVAIKATDLIKDLAEIHTLNGEGARALGEAVLGALMVGSYCKQGERVNLNIQTSGRVQQALIDAYPEGFVRGYVVERTSFPPAKDGQTGPWSEGFLSILRTKGAEGRQPYIGTVPLVTGHLAKDLTYYWVQSEQIPSAVGLAVTLDKEGEIATAAGFLVQILPGATHEEIQQVERHVHELQGLAQELAEDADPLRLLSRIFEDTAFIIVENKTIELRCNCSKDRVERALMLVSTEDLQSMLNENRQAIIHCDFCRKEYTIDEADLRRLISGKTRQ